MNVAVEDANIKRRKITGRATVIFITAMLLLTFFSRTINNFTLPKVTYETPASGALIKEVTGTGNVEANTTQDLYVSNSMKVTGVMVDVGDSVKQGQTLLTLDTSDIENQLEDELDMYAQKMLHLEELMEAGSPESMMSLDKAVQIARQNVEKAQKNHDSSKALYEAGAIAAINLTDAEMNLDNAKLDYEIAKNNKDKAISSNKRDIESTKLDISMAERKIAELTKEMNMSTVTAPCDGVVTELYYSAGMTANASQPLYRIADTGGGFQFVATVNISAAEYLEPGDEAKLSINSLNDRIIQGKVNQITDNQQQIGAKKDIVIDIPPDGLIGGEIGTADIKKSIGSYKVLVPNSAVGQDNKGSFVYVLKEREGPLGKEFYVERVSVSIGDSDNTKTVVLSGINAMDKVISDSDKPLEDGSPVMIAN
ncbi:HlyD family efflux transporter periplasmic adaptor subunit [Desulfosporosinus fructosivorans]|uniref:HlyD family efflux transporter periplasmic adaptor subunit n=1 Tax=Desulfosporosinus fructosivorans TaxID=2018669 RepID=A0A4Z0QYJ8_9FIRM|nr:efflux RND transporter periplasmic adaptor subunit [Desulfosporosinus fructosivorans]TGE35510.1 HlyD family efflux transporter periplasmic adaptor subunit [Desulfosporosinus fructosivorans]